MKTQFFYALLAGLVLSASAAFAQQAVPTNRYGMKLEQKADGSYALQREYRYAKILNLIEIPDLYTPYVHQNDRLSGKLYNKVETVEIVYKGNLKIAVDKAISDTPSPVLFFCHGGGWARGDFEASRSLTKYLAQNHGITGVRIEYTLAPEPGANVQVSIGDILDAVQYIRDHAAELNIDPSRMAFGGSSAGAHLAACAALQTKEAKVFFGNSGIYDLTTAAIVQNSKDEERIRYFGNRDEKYLRAASPVYLIPKRTNIAAQLFCGTGDVTVEYSQSEVFAQELKRHKAKVDLQVYKYYDHSLNAKASDKMEEIFFKTVDFVVANL
ncbi:MAG: alpha/beta hydrolase [Bacteroidales bacterium]|nr:alpha/beta hydrolase [Bacteroidales bacterium]MBP5521517.1 alpha/beta hydrolase [Bacteroidales bacterium]